MGMVLDKTLECQVVLKTTPSVIFNGHREVGDKQTTICGTGSYEECYAILHSVMDEIKNNNNISCNSEHEYSAFYTTKSKDSDGKLNSLKFEIEIENTPIEVKTTILNQLIRGIEREIRINQSVGNLSDEDIAELLMNMSNDYKTKSKGCN